MTPPGDTGSNDLASSAEGQPGEETPLLDTSLKRGSVSVIAARALSRESLARGLGAAQAQFEIHSHDSIAAWQAASSPAPVRIVLLAATGQAETAEAIQRDLVAIAEIEPEARVIIISDVEDPATIVSALGHGAKGYIGQSLSLHVAVEAIKLVSAGGTFVPASALLSVRTNPGQLARQASPPSPSLFTPRQLEVIASLRRGEPNKIIAYKLQMAEASVKTHIRAIMKKLNARSRTEVAFLAKDFIPAEPERDRHELPR